MIAARAAKRRTPPMIKTHTDPADEEEDELRERAYKSPVEARTMPTVQARLDRTRVFTC
jgi:hypothetical protein